MSQKEEEWKERLFEDYLKGNKAGRRTRKESWVDIRQKTKENERTGE